MTDVTLLREVAPSATIAPQVRIGPYCVIGPNVTIGAGTVLGRRITVTGHTTIGADNFIDEGCALGTGPQDLKYHGESSLLLIGDRNRFGRNVTIHVGTEFGGWLTRIGHDNVLGVGCHVAHDCYVDDETSLGRTVLLAGHVRVNVGAVIEDQAAAHHFTTIGKYARVGPRTPVRRDVPPYTNFCTDAPEWWPAAVKGVHEVGIRRAKLPSDEEIELRGALRELFADESALQTKIEQLMHLGVEGEAAALCTFCRRSLQGVFGRHREILRGRTPPEAGGYQVPVTGRRPL